MRRRIALVLCACLLLTVSCGPLFGVKKDEQGNYVSDGSGGLLGVGLNLLNPAYAAMATAAIGVGTTLVAAVKGRKWKKVGKTFARGVNTLRLTRDGDGKITITEKDLLALFRAMQDSENVTPAARALVHSVEREDTKAGKRVPGRA